MDPVAGSVPLSTEACCGLLPDLGARWETVDTVLPDSGLL